MYDCIIIGGGPAGMTAGIYLSRKKTKSLLITKDFIGQVGKTSIIENYPGFESITGINLINKIKNQLYKNSNTNIIEGEVVIKIEKKDKIFSIFTNLNKYKSKTIIIATGTTHRKAGILGEEKFYGKGVSYCSVCDSPLFENKITIVVGGGNSAILAVIDLLPYSKKIYLLVRGDKIIADLVLFDKIKNKKNVFIFLNSEISQIKGDKKVHSIDFFDKKNKKNFIIPIHGIFIKIGLSPNISFLNKIKYNNILNDKKEIIIDSYNSSTTIPGFFSAGDVTNTKDKQITTAIGDGTKAALSVFTFLNQEYY